MPERAPAPDPRGRILKTVGRDRQRTPAEIIRRLQRQHRALGLPVHLPSDHVRKRVGRPQPR